MGFGIERFSAGDTQEFHCASERDETEPTLVLLVGVPLGTIRHTPFPQVIQTGCDNQHGGGLQPLGFVD
jgi:hypothetical protein